nr:ribonuclease H-like domain-containing protein [Planctomycetota bacterium]
MVAPDRDKLRRSFRVPKVAPVAPEGARLDGEAPPAAPIARAEAAEGMLAYLQRRRSENRSGFAAVPPRPVVTLPEGCEEITAYGPMWRRELRYPTEFVHGAVTVGAALQLDHERLAVLAKDDSFATLDPRQCLFLDTETTGLAGGAGTVVFAYGLAFFRGDEFVLEQTFLRDFGEEPAMLHHVRER